MFHNEPFYIDQATPVLIASLWEDVNESDEFLFQDHMLVSTSAHCVNFYHFLVYIVTNRTLIAQIDINRIP